MLPPTGSVSLLDGLVQRGQMDQAWSRVRGRIPPPIGLSPLTAEAILAWALPQDPAAVVQTCTVLVERNPLRPVLRLILVQALMATQATALALSHAQQIDARTLSMDQAKLLSRLIARLRGEGTALHQRSAPPPSALPPAPPPR